ncbi:MAG: hypothetical protein ACO1PI_02640 [Bacteroidota bacterium]
MQEVWIAFGIHDAKTILNVLMKNGIEGKVQEETTEVDAFMAIDPDLRIYRVFVAEQDAQNASKVIENYIETIEEEEIRNNPYEELTDEDLLRLLLLDFAGEDINSLHKELESRGLTEEDIKKGKQKISESMYLIQRADDFTFFLGFMGALAGGLGGIKVGMELYLSNDTHSITGERYYKYDSLTRKYGLWMIIGGSAVLLFFIIFIFF